VSIFFFPEKKSRKKEAKILKKSKKVMSKKKSFVLFEITKDPFQTLNIPTSAPPAPLGVVAGGVPPSKSVSSPPPAAGAATAPGRC